MAVSLPGANGLGPYAMHKNFFRSESGNFNLIFAVALVPLVTVVAGMVDLTNISRKADKVQNALDTAALEIGVHYYSGMSAEELGDLGRHIFLANIVDLEQADFLYEQDLVPSFEAEADYGEVDDFISVRSAIIHDGMVGWLDGWRTNRGSMVRVRPGPPACVLALDRSASPAIAFRGSTEVDMENCVIAANSRAHNAILRDGAARVSAECMLTSGGTSGISGSGNARLECGEPLENQYASMDPLRHVKPPSYTACQGVSSGRKKTLSPGTYCNQTISGEVTLEPGIYVLRGGKVNLGGNGSLVGDGVTIFLMEDAEFGITANHTVQLTPPSNGTYAGITIYQPASNKTQVTINGGADSFVDGFLYAPGAHVFFAGNADTLADRCLRLVGATIEMTGTSSLRSDCEAELGGRKIFAGRHISIVR